MYDVLSALLSALLLRLQHFGVRRSQDKECVLKLSWPSTAEYRTMKLKKKIIQYSTVENIAAAISGASAHGALTAGLRSTDQLPQC